MKEWCKPKMEYVCFQLKLCFWKCVGSSNKIQFLPWRWCLFLLWFSFTAQSVVSEWVLQTTESCCSLLETKESKLFSVAPSLWVISSSDSQQTPETSQHVVGEYRFSPEDICTTFTALSDTPTQLHTYSDNFLTPNKLTFLATTITTMLGAK